MIEIRISRELGDFKPKFVGPLTFRQFLCVLGGAVPIYFLYTQLKGHIPVDIIGFLCIIPAAIAGAFGWFKPYGMKMEVFLSSIFITTFLAPAKRRYQAPNRTYALLAKVSAAELAAQEADALGGKRKMMKKKKAEPPKYKRSPLAYN